MKYSPSPQPGPQALPRYVQDELRKIADSLGATIDEATALEAIVDGLVVGFGSVTFQAADLVIASTTTYQDSGMSAALDVGRYTFEQVAIQTSHATPDLKNRLNFTGTASAVSLMNATWGVASGNTIQQAFNLEATLTTTGLHMSHKRGGFEVTAAGVLTYQVGQVTSSANAVTLHRNSWMRIQRIE